MLKYKSDSGSPSDSPTTPQYLSHKIITQEGGRMEDPMARTLPGPVSVSKWDTGTAPNSPDPIPMMRSGSSGVPRVTPTSSLAPPQHQVTAS